MFQSQIFHLNQSQFWDLFPFLILTLSFAIAVFGAGLKRSSGFFRALGFGTFAVAALNWSFLLFRTDATFLGLSASPLTRIVGVLVSCFAALSFISFDVAAKYKERPEWLALLFLCAMGLSLLPCAKDWISFFVFLEMFSIPAYVLVAYDVKRERSLEASMKYMLSGAFASGLLLMGIALAYLLSGTMDYAGLFASFPPTGNPLATLSLLLIFAGVLFKMTVFPFHFWAPDVYQGAPMGIAAFLASATKLSVFVATSLAFSQSGFSFRPDLLTAAVFAACASALLGSFLAFTQRSFRRMLAYSGTVNAGLLAPLMVSGASGISSGIFFLFIYGATVMLILSAFSSILVSRGLDCNDDLDVESFSKKDGILSGTEVLVLSTALLSLAGIPPLPGFVAKYWILLDLWNMGHKNLVYFGLAASLMGVAYYVRIAGKLFFLDKKEVALHP